ncbi:hypothetical protein [Brachyspira intermedia]|uniref:hypothetical protein n=1 Tax=Brachyspira intermedia TaxID=84377 RepID=UPI00059AEC9C|nr:hypothetical protein [Brachyspira intermedia]
MNKLGLPSSLQSFYNCTLSSGVSYQINSVVFILSDYRLKLYSYNPPLDDIKIIIHHNKEDYMSLKKY